MNALIKLVEDAAKATNEVVYDTAGSTPVSIGSEVFAAAGDPAAQWAGRGLLPCHHRPWVGVE